MASIEREIGIRAGKALLQGTLVIPRAAKGIILFAHGSGSSRFSSRNRFVAKELNRSGFATLLFDLLTKEEEIIDEHTAEFRFDIGLLTERLVLVTDWILNNSDTAALRIGYFGASTGAAAALAAAAKRQDVVRAIVSRGGRPDLAGQSLTEVRCPTLLIVGGEDREVIELNRKASEKMGCENRIVIVNGATHLFEEEGKLEEVATHAIEWFAKYL